MKKNLLIAGVLILGLVMSRMAFAAETYKATTAKSTAGAMMTIEGKILSIDTAKNQIVVKDKAGVEKTISVSAKEITGLKTGEEVKVSLNADSNMASSIKKVK